VEFTTFISLTRNFFKKIKFRVSFEVTCKIIIVLLFLKQCWNIKRKFDIRHIFIQLAHTKRNTIHEQHYGSHGQSLAASKTVWQGTKIADLSLTHIWRNVAFLCGVSLETKLMSSIRESIKPSKKEVHRVYRKALKI